MAQINGKKKTFCQLAFCPKNVGCTSISVFIKNRSRIRAPGLSRFQSEMLLLLL